MKAILKDRRFSLTLLVLVVSALLLANAQAFDNQPKDTSSLPFGSQEELVYEGEFTKAILRGINIAELRFSANRTPSSATNSAGKSTPDVLHFIIEAETKGILRKLFGLNFHQRVESTVEPSSFSVLQTTKLDEQGKRKRASEAIFDKSTGQIVWTERDPNDPTREPRVVTAQASGAVQDIASAFYYLRIQPLEVGKSFEILISDSGQVYHIPVAVTERKKMKTIIGNVQTLRVEPDIFGDGRLLRGKGKLTLWFTDDSRHIPVRARINNEMGTLDIKLKNIRANNSSVRH
jgi:hypothetical protein